MRARYERQPNPLSMRVKVCAVDGCNRPKVFRHYCSEHAKFPFDSVKEVAKSRAKAFRQALQGSSGHEDERAHLREPPSLKKYDSSTLPIRKHPKKVQHTYRGALELPGGVSPTPSPRGRRYEMEDAAKYEALEKADRVEWKQKHKRVPHSEIWCPPVRKTKRAHGQHRPTYSDMMAEGRRARASPPPRREERLNRHRPAQLDRNSDRPSTPLYDHVLSVDEETPLPESPQSKTDTELKRKRRIASARASLSRATTQPVAPTSPGSANAKRLWGVAVRSVDFLNKLTSLKEVVREGEQQENVLSIEEFMRVMERLPKHDLIDGVKRMFTSLQHFRTLLSEAKMMSVDLNQLHAFRTIVDRIRHVVHAEAVTMFLVDRSKEFLYAAASTMPDLNLEVPMGTGVVGFSAQYQRVTLLSSGAQDDERFNVDVDGACAISKRVDSLLVVPVMNDHRDVLAVLVATNKRDKGHAFTPEDQTMMEFLSLIARHVIMNAVLYSEAITRKEHTATLLQITELISTEIDCDRVIARIVSAANKLVDAELITLFQVSEDTDELVSTGEVEERVSIRKGGVLGYAATTGKTVVVNDVEHEWRFPSCDTKRAGITVNTVLAVPVSDMTGHTVAIIEAINKRNGVFEQEDVALLGSMSSYAGMVLRKAQLYADAVRRRNQTEALLEITELMSAELGTDKLKQNIVRASYKLVNAEKITLYMVQEHTHELIDDTDGTVTELGTGVAGHVALTGRSVNIFDAQKDWRFLLQKETRASPRASMISQDGGEEKSPRAPPNLFAGLSSEVDESNVSVVPDGRLRVQTVVAIPVKDYLGKTVAVLEAINKKEKGERVVPFDNEDVELLKSLGTTAGSVLRKAQLYEEAITRRRQKEALLQITEHMSEEIGVEQVMQRIIKSSYHLIQAERITLFRVNRNSKEIVCAVSKDPFFQGVRMQYGKGIIGVVASSGRSLNIKDPYHDSRFDPTVDKKTNYRTRSLLTVPVTNRQGDVVAVIQAVNKRGEMSFSNEDVQIMESMAVSAGLILHKSELYEEALASERRATALMNLVKVTTLVERDPMATVRAISKVAYEALNADRVTIYFVDRMEDELLCVLSKEGGGWKLPIGKGLPGRVAETGSIINIPDAYEDNRFNSEQDERMGYTTKSVCCYPVFNEERQVIAVIQALNKKNTKDPDGEPVGFTQEDLDLLEAFAMELGHIFRRHMTEVFMSHREFDNLQFSMVDMYRDRNLPMINRRKHPDVSSGGQPAKRLSVPLPRSPVQATRELDSLEFNVFDYDDDQLLTFCFHIFQSTGVVEQFKLDPEKLQNFFMQVREGYNDNPFHCWKHGFSVLHVTYLQLRQFTNARVFLENKDVLGLLVASICHDLDHPGNTNSFEVNSESPLALLHNDLSVLENHHAYKTFFILRNSKSAIFADMDLEWRKEIKSTIVQGILATDMTIHFESCKRLDARTEPFYDREREADRQEVVNVLIHSSDLSGQIFPTRIAVLWEERITAELLAQVEKEKKLGLPVAEFMLKLGEKVARLKNQVSFIQFVLVPWWQAVTRIFPDLKPCYLNLCANREYFQGKMAEAAAEAPEHKA